LVGGAIIPQTSDIRIIFDLGQRDVVGDILVSVEDLADIDLSMVDRVDTRTPLARIGLGFLTGLAVMDEFLGFADIQRCHIVTPFAEVGVAH